MRKLAKILHLWLGLISGIVVVIVCLTGALYAFKDEITAIGEPWRKVPVSTHAPLKPSQMISAAQKAAGAASPSAITYGKTNEAVFVDYFSNEGQRTTVYLHPATAKVLHVSRSHAGEFNFFDFLIQGHLRLWLPRAWGSQVVGWSVLLFLITLITGIVMWYPRRWTRKAAESRFSLHRLFKFKRLVYDLHNVIGFYALIPLIAVSFTGLIFAFDWFSSGLFYLMSGGRSYVAYEMPATDTTKAAQVSQPLDAIYARVTAEEPKAVQFYYALPQTDADVYRVSVVHESGSYYKQDNRFFDARSATELQGNGAYTGKYSQKSGAEQAIRMSLDIHEGRVWGLFGRILMVIASLVGASLPVTGLMLYLQRKRPKGKPNAKPEA